MAGLRGRAAWSRQCGISPAKLVDSLREIFEVERDEFWSWHWTFSSARLAKPQPLLGGARVTDLAVNVILPWLWARAAEGKNATLRREIERRYFAWPAAEDNSVLKLARQRLLGIGRSRALRSAAAQQGLMQIIRDFCETLERHLRRLPVPGIGAQLVLESVAQCRPTRVRNHFTSSLANGLFTKPADCGSSGTGTWSSRRGTDG